MNPLDGCVCFAIPPKLFRRLVEAGHAAHDHHRHSHALRSLRYEEHKAPARSTSRRIVKRSVYDVANGDTLPGQLARKEGGKTARDRAVNQAYTNAGIALAFYKTVFGLNSVDGRGMPVVSTVHYGQNFPNAMWNGRQMIYGDGDESVGGFTEALDIIAHELSHGVTQHLVPQGLGVARIPVKEREFKEQKYTLKGEAGALNESFSDVFGSMVKQWHRKQTPAEADWLIGEGILAPIIGRAIRSLKRPGDQRLTSEHDEQFWHVDEMNQRDSWDAHDASGIPNHAFYWAAKTLKVPSWQKLGPVWMDAYAALKPKATFEDAAGATLAAAEARFGSGSNEAKAVRSGWRRVGVL